MSEKDDIIKVADRDVLYFHQQNTGMIRKPKNIKDKKQEMIDELKEMFQETKTIKNKNQKIIEQYKAVSSNERNKGQDVLINISHRQN